MMIPTTRRIRCARFFVPLGLAAILESCASLGVLSHTAPPSSEVATSMPVRTDDSARANAGVAPAAANTAGPIVREQGSGSVVAGLPAQSSVTEAGDISLNYVDTDVREIARLILGDILKVNYSIDPGFMGTVTIQTPRPLKREALLPTLQSLLVQAGGQLTYQEGIFRIGPTGDDTVVTPLVDGASAQSGSQIVALRFASARQLAAMLDSYVGEGAKILADPTRNVLIVTGSASARQNIVGLIRVFDVDYLAAQSYALYPAKSGDPAKFAADLQAALQLDNDGALAGSIKIVSVEQANAIMVIARQPAYLDRVARLIAQLDQVKDSAGRNIHVYYLKNGQPADIQPILQRAVNPSAGEGEVEIAPGNLPPTAQPVQIAGSPATPPTPANSQAPTRPIGAGIGGAPASQMATQAANTASADLGREGSGGNARGPQIIADRRNNALVIVATESEYATIEAAIRKLDILPMQVLIEATVAEVTLNDSLQYGTQFYLANHEGQITYSNAVSGSPTLIDPTNPIGNSKLFPGTLAPNFPGFALARTVGSMQLALQALKSITDVQIISAPQLLVLDNQQASFQVGDLVPTITQSAVSVETAGAPVINNVQYQPTGVILTVTPRVNSGGLVTLDIEQEVSDVVPTTSSSINSPTFQQRRIKTKVVVQDGDTISLAGLISARRFRGNSGLPLLGEIPVLGSLFSTRDNRSDRTELLVLLTPRVVYDQHDARALTEELRRKLAPSRIVP
jgi:general secretion pathway protein D